MTVLCHTLTYAMGHQQPLESRTCYRSTFQCTPSVIQKCMLIDKVMLEHPNKQANKHLRCGNRKRAARSQQPNTPMDGSKNDESSRLCQKQRHQHLRHECIPLTKSTSIHQQFQTHNRLHIMFCTSKFAYYMSPAP